MKKLLIMWMICLLLAGCALTPPTEPVETQPDVVPIQTQPVTEPTMLPIEVLTIPPTEAPDIPPEDDELVRAADFIPGIRQNLRYATEDNFTGQQIYDFADAYLRYGTVKKLQAACAELARQNLGILIWDGFRPVAAQEKLWEICPDPAFVSHPVTGSRSHCRGSAIDLTLVDLKTGKTLEMPTDFDDFSKLADRDYSDCAVEAADNARILETVMKKHGFKPYSAEWWHFSDTEDYPVEENFCPEQTIFMGGVG